MRRYFLGALSALSFVACGPKGPLVTDCISNPAKKNFICFNEAQNKQLVFQPGAVDNWIFVSAADERALLSACANHQGGVKVSVCIFSAVSLSFACFNEVTGKSFGMTFEESENWIGVSAVDEQIVLDYCASREG